MDKAEADRLAAKALSGMSANMLLRLMVHHYEEGDIKMQSSLLHRGQPVHEAWVQWARDFLERQRAQT